jgi:hypothetical protein
MSPSADMCYIPDDVFAIVGRYLADDCVSLLNLVKTKKAFGDIIRTEVNIDEMKQSYIDYGNCLKIFTYVKKLSDYSFKLELTTYDLDMNIELLSNNGKKTNEVSKIREKIELYEAKIKKNNRRVDKVMVLVKHPRCLHHFEEFIYESYQMAHYERTCYISNRIRLMASQKLYDIILSIDNTFRFHYEIPRLMNWIRESNDYNSDEDTFQDFNY